MQQFAPHIYSFVLPLFTGNLLHMVIVKRNYFTKLTVPISMKSFGPGKTYRAFVIMPPVCGAGSLALRSFCLHDPGYSWSFFMGAILGIAYLLGELPNSFIKRKLGIPSGQSTVRYRLVQNIIDKCDSLLCCCIVYYFVSSITLYTLVVLFLLSFVIHVAFSALLVRLNIKKSF